MSQKRRQRLRELNYHLPSIRPTLADAVALLAAAAILALAGWSRMGADYTSIAPPFRSEAGWLVGQKEGVHPFSNPLSPGARPDFFRPLATLIVEWLPGAAESTPAELTILEKDADATKAAKTRKIEEFRRSNAKTFARSLHVATIVAMAFFLAGVFVWLKVLLRAGANTIVPAAATAVLAASPWLAGLSGSILAFSEVLSLAFMAWALALYSVNTYGELETLWMIAPFVWLFGFCAMLCSEAALGLVLYGLLIDAAAMERGTKPGMILRARALTSWLPMAILAAGIMMFSSVDPVKRLAEVPARASYALALAPRSFDSFNFLAAGRWPGSLPSWMGAGALLAVLGAAIAMACVKRLRLSALWLAGLAIALALTALPGKGTSAADFSLMAFPSVFLALFAVSAAAALFGSKVGAPGVAWRVGFIGAIAALAVAMGLAQHRRLRASVDRADYLLRAAEARPILPELKLLAGGAKISEALSAASRQGTIDAARQARVLRKEGFEQFLKLRAENPKVEIGVASEAATPWVKDLLVEGRREEAIDFLRDMASADPNQPIHKLQLAFLLAEAGDFDEAGEWTRKALDLAGGKTADAFAESPEEKSMLAFLLLRAGELDRGRDLLSQSAPMLQAPERAVAMGARLFGEGQEEGAIRFFSTLIDKAKLGPADLATARFERARVYSRLERHADAAADLDAAMKRPEVADRARALLAFERLSMNDFDGVAKLCRQPGESERIPEFEDFLRQNAARAIREGKAEKAKAWLDVLVARAQPGLATSRALQLRGALAESQQRVADALADLRKAVAEAPRDSNARRALSSFLLRHEFPEEARQTLVDGFSLAGDNVDMMAAYAELMIQLGRASEAASVLEGQLEANPGDQRPEPRLLLGKLYASLDLFESSAGAFRKALDLAPGNAAIKLALASVLAKTEKHEEGAELVVELIAADPTNPVYYLRLADMFESRGDVESASMTIARGVQNTGGKSADLFFRGAQLTFKTGELPAAEIATRKALSLDPEHAGAKELLKQLEESKKRLERLEQMKRSGAAAPKEEAADVVEPDLAEPSASE
jgi:tetratricopeptide (TPR) repeat protein